MNDSPYGLTASVWTDAEGNPESEAAFLKIVDELFTGTVYLNRCVPSPTAHWCLLLTDRCDAGATTSIRRSRGRA